MSVDNVQRAKEECIAFHEALRRLGYLPQHLFVEVVTDGRTERLASFVVLRAPSVEETWLLAWHFDSEAESQTFVAQWPAFVVEWNTAMANAERERIYGQSFVRHHAYELVMLMERKSGHSIARTALARLQAGDMKA